MSVPITSIHTMAALMRHDENLVLNILTYLRIKIRQNSEKTELFYECLTSVLSDLWTSIQLWRPVYYNPDTERRRMALGGLLVVPMMAISLSYLHRAVAHGMVRLHL